MPPAGIPPKRALPSKEASLFKEVLNLYETRQLKKGLKAADQILKKFPDHGETICMKGLVLTHMGRRDEGLELVKKGVRLDLTSHICWHVFGLIQKGEKNYEEALKSYSQALRFDKENLNILRDAAHLQTQLRIFDGLVETRHTLLRLRPTLRQNWVGLSVAYHLNGNLSEAKKVLEHYEMTLKNVPDYDVEHSEVLLYHVRVLEELGETNEALALLDVNAKSRAIIDRVAIMEFRARLLSKLGMEDAEHTWQALIEQNPDCHDYYRGFLSNRGIDLGRVMTSGKHRSQLIHVYLDTVTDENRGEALKCLRDFADQHLRASAPRRLALNLAVGDEFKALVEPYLMSGLDKGIPSLFADIKALYQDSHKQQVIEDIVEALREKLAPSPDDTAPASEPTTYLWTLYFLAQHHSYLSRHQRALSLLDQATSHTPTLPELLMFRARVLKRCGDPFGAVRCMDEARCLDLQDRFLNTKCGKYRLRAGLVEEASEIFGLFTKKDAPSPGADLEDMQSLLYLKEEADAQLRTGNIGLALKRYMAVQKVFDEIEDDQFDFHGYSLRKFTVNVYIDMIIWEDHLRSHPAYVYSAIAASQVSNLTDAEKKAKKKAKKAAHKVHEETKKNKGLEPGPVKDDDPDGTKLMKAPDLLERAAKLLKPLSTLAAKNIDVWIAIYDVSVRRKKYLQAVKALNHARSLDPANPELHIRIVHLRNTITALSELPPAPVSPVLSAAISTLLPDELSLEVFNSQYLQQHPGDAKVTLAAAKVSRILGAPREEVESAVFGVLADEEHLTIKASCGYLFRKLFVAQSVLELLNEIHSPRADEFRAACDAKFELSTLFKPASEILAMRHNVLEGDIAKEEVEKAEILS
ncbi:N-alpha-acetyltransferase 16, NatA auxiliary subunit [Grifola frondosa]|uniref:N-alpha-acetyltransferase 16, NatA auxiliary subunit n=1 Tax=Grifola frondosa TaxID=5627 RepID=A0A1C7MLH1_GRIFR|nr:N-alpha-acetyltransferase 16, NatA auxiliary subunit [Grifola frondosa]